MFQQSPWRRIAWKYQKTSHTSLQHGRKVAFIKRSFSESHLNPGFNDKYFSDRFMVISPEPVELFQNLQELWRTETRWSHRSRLDSVFIISIIKLTEFVFQQGLLQLGHYSITLVQLFQIKPQLKALTDLNTDMSQLISMSDLFICTFQQVSLIYVQFVQLVFKA